MSALRDLVRRVVPASVRRTRLENSFKLQIDSSGEAELSQLAHFVKPGDLALDIGANAGVYAWALARLGASVMAFEPNPAMADVLAIAAGNSDSIKIMRVALSDRDGTAELSLPESNTGLATLRTDLAAANDPHFSVPTRRLDSLDLGPVAFIKIDVEGHEEATIAGGLATITRDKPVMLIEIEERHNAGGLDRIAALLAGIGYSCWFLMDGNWISFADFAMETHQRIADIEPMNSGTARRICRYYNNFLFLPAGRTMPGSH